MVLHNPNNWHWVNKDVREWARDYLEKNLVDTKAEDDENEARVSKVMSMEGDVDVSQRKGKVITLFDVKVQLEYEGHTKNDDEVEGTITIPEVAHDTEEDEYVFEIDIYSESAAKAPIKPLIRNKILPQLRTKLAALGPALVSEHGKDIQHATGQPLSLPTSKVTSSSHVSQSSKSSTAKSVDTATAGRPAVNTTSLTVTDEFRTTAEELFTTFTTADRLAAFTRAPPTVFEGAKPGAKFALFGGNVSGEFVALDAPRKITQKWRLGSWVQGHFSNLEIIFDQNDTDRVTSMRVEWSGVPVGEEEVVRRNWGEYYVRSIKTTFGFGTVL